MRGLARFILGGRINAIFIAGFFGSLSLYFLPLSIFSAASIGLIQLRSGEKQWLDTAFFSGILILVTFLLSPDKPGFPFPAVFALWVIVFFAALVLRRTASQSYALMAIGLVCALFVLGMHLFIDNVVGWWAEWLRLTQPENSTALDEFGTDGLSRLTNGLMAMFAGFASMFALLFARWMQAVLFNPGGFASEFVSIRLPRSLLFGVTAILLGFGSVNMQIMDELFMVVMMVYFFPGLSVLHGIVIKRRLHKVWAMVPYVGVILFPQIFIPGCAILGAADTFANFRGMR